MYLNLDTYRILTKYISYMKDYKFMRLSIYGIYKSVIKPIL